MALKFWPLNWPFRKTANQLPDADSSEPGSALKPAAQQVGYIRSPARAGKNQNSSAYGGMGERELQLKLELLIEPVLSAQNSVFACAQALADCSMADQERFLDSVKCIADANVELAFQFCQLAPRGLKNIDEKDWHTWIKRILASYQQQGLNACLGVIQQLDDYIDVKAKRPHAVSFDEISRIIEGIVTGLNGRALKLQANEQLFTDTQTIHLPENISTFKNHAENFALYKSIAIHQWAQTWFGTWRVDLQQLAAGFADQQRAIRLFHKLETARLDACIKRELPGTGRALESFNSLLSASDLPPAWQSAVQALSKQEATAHDTAKLLYELYEHEFMPADTLYQGILNPALTRQKIQQRTEEDKAALKAQLSQLQQELNSSRQTPVDESHDSDRFEIRNVEDDEMPDGYRLELTYDGATIEAGEQAQQLLASIQQDLGAVPPEYLNDINANAFNTGAGEENNQAIDIHPDSDDVFLYDEWDHSRQQYRKAWCRLREHEVAEKPSDFVEKTLSKHRGLLKHLHRTFEALREQDRRIRRQPFGEDIDIDALVSSLADLINGAEIDQNLFIKQRKVERNIAVMFMVDMSGSTSGWINAMEREALVLLCESLQHLGDRYAIYGFSGATRQRCDLYKIKTFEEAYTASVKNRIANITPKDYTRMGAAIRHLAKLLGGVEAKTKILITLSDGRPDDRDGYRGIYGIEDTRRALIETKGMGINTFCITIDEQAMQYLQHMYGPVNFTIVNQVGKLPYKVSDIYRRITV